MRKSVPVLIAALLAGCSQAPAYHPPVLPAPAAFREAGPWAPAAPASPARDAWWQAFGDPALDALETRLAADSPTLAIALARHDAALATAAGARAQLFPTIGIGATLTADRQSDDRPLRGSNQPDLYGAHTLGAVAAFDPDPWGALRDNLAAAKAEAQASADDADAVRLALQTELADAVIGLRGADRQIGILAGAVDDFTRADTLTRNRFKGGIASGVDVGRSGAQLADAEAQLADARAARARIEHGIAVLVGANPSTFALAPLPAPLPLVLPPLPALVPSALLQRRPDVAAAERRMFAANRDIGVARAAWFPSIVLGGQGGTQATTLAGLFSAPNLFWSVGPNLAATLFDGGRRHARLAAAHARWDAATGAYREVALGAFREVADGLSQLHWLGDERAAQTRAVEMSGMAAHLSTNRYVKGAESFLDVVTAQTAALAAQRRAAAIETAEAQAAVGLIRATGGGWAAAG